MSNTTANIFARSGFSGYSGTGASGYSGISGASNSGFSGYSGISGNGSSGFSGYSGISGGSVEGFSGYSGAGGTGASGYSGISGASSNGASGYSGISGVSGAENWTILVKTADTTRTANTTITADPTLTFTLAAATKYKLRMRVWFDTTAAGDFKYRHTGSATPAVVRIQRNHTLPAGTTFVIAVDAAFSAADVAMAGTGTNGGYIEWNGIIHNTNAGTFAFAWAQNTSDAGNTIVRAGSYLEYTTV
jgi:hypothetical protein